MGSRLTAMELMLMMRPHFSLRISFAASLDTRKAPRRLVSTMLLAALAAMMRAY